MPFDSIWCFVFCCRIVQSHKALAGTSPSQDVGATSPPLPQLELVRCLTDLPDDLLIACVMPSSTRAVAATSYLLEGEVVRDVVEALLPEGRARVDRLQERGGR